ncbi:PIN domain-containing protein [Synechococcales cyanobacterium C]|uniref:PIN domain-containing protein n=1 Tax=Petrachloros mirabilis ULC683 TaxID=2781853 RepID=A0A8K1ZY97_9CYAN|nr:type II toxin-antitoxin system VapC family toxin [Petrachloros mirabilis]NCJ07083.1 PIN domain-containing protein [Petrachloros mirabilis ULC683]
MTAVLDASALLAFLLDEPGQEQVDQVLSKAVISGVNWAEVLQQLIRRGAKIDGCRDDLEALGLSIRVFDAESAEQTARLWPESRAHGLSLGDRACIALGIDLNVPILTGDHIWATAYPSLPIQLIR